MKKIVAKNKVGVADFDVCKIRICVLDNTEGENYIAGSILADRAWKFFHSIGPDYQVQNMFGGTHTQASIFGKKRCLRGWSLEETDWYNQANLWFEVNHIPTVEEVQEMTRRCSLLLLKPLTKKERDSQ